MKYLYIIVLTTIIFSCKNDSKTIPNVSNNEEIITSEILNDTTLQEPEDYNDIELNKALSIELKQQTFIEKEDERKEMQDLIIEKKYVKDEDLFIIDFTYPLLNEEIKPTNVNFNEYINDHYVNIKGTEAAILEDKELICDTIRTNRYREKRFIDYKVYNVNDDLVSILFYKENFYSGTLHPTYSFDCMNFDLNRGVFMNYEDFFRENSEEEFLVILNEEISKEMLEGDLYYDCWKLTSDDFYEYRDNFVLNETYVEYYFDDCVMCPSYTGSYSIEIPLVKLLSVLRKYDINPLVF